MAALPDENTQPVDEQPSAAADSSGVLPATDAAATPDAAPPADAPLADAPPDASTSSPAEGSGASVEERESEPEEAEPDEPEPEFEGHVEPLEFIDEEAERAEELKFDWYILKIQVNREDSIREALLRKIKIAGLERYFQEIVIPTEDVAEFNKAGKRRIVKRKLYPGYLMVSMHVNDESWFLVRETPGIGDFTGAGGRPSPMLQRDVERILNIGRQPGEGDTQVRTAIPFKPADRVRVKEGYFQNFEGEVHSIDEANGRVTVMINIFGRSTPVELEHWQIEAV